MSAPALAILHKLAESRHSDFVFPGVKAGKPLSNMALLALLKRMGRSDLTVHGFRSAFRDWAAELTHSRTIINADGGQVQNYLTPKTTGVNYFRNIKRVA